MLSQRLYYANYFTSQRHRVKRDCGRKSSFVGSVGSIFSNAVSRPLIGESGNTTLQVLLGPISQVPARFLVFSTVPTAALPLPRVSPVPFLYCSIVIRAKVSGRIGGLPPPAGAGPNLADTMNSRCVIGSSPILREPTGVLSV